MADSKLPFSVERDAWVRKASSASPALGSLERASRERQGYRSQFERDAWREQERRDLVYVAPDGGRPRNLVGASQGRPLTGFEVERRLLQLNPALIFEPSPVPGRVCIRYRILDPVLGLTTNYACAMERGLMPEFSILHYVEEEYFDARTRATPEGTGLIKKRRKINERDPETRGWRTVLVRLIKQRLITREGAERLFGLPSKDSHLWQANLE